MAQNPLENAGKQPGLQVWRVAKMKLALVPDECYGEFFTGDCYLVLNTCSGYRYNVHAWQGVEASQDERGAAAIYMTQLDCQLGGQPVQYRECQGHESAVFCSYFKGGLRYLAGGVASGFNHTDINVKNDKKVLQVKGRRPVRATEVEVTWKSFNKGDCFLIQLGQTIYHWSGSCCNYFERLKATELAIALRDNEGSGRKTIEMIEEGSEPEAVLKELGTKPDLPLGTDDTNTTTIKNRNAASLYQISDTSGTMKLTLQSEKPPFQQDSLCQTECYLLDHQGNKVIYVWKGKKANPDERKKAAEYAEEFITEKSYDPGTQIQIMAEGAENTLFKDLFFNWVDKDETTGVSEFYTMGSIAQVPQVPFDASTLHKNQTMAARHAMVDDGGSGEVQIWRVEDSDKVLVDPSTYGQFYGGDCYLVLYSYNAECKKKHIIYTWQGQKCSKDELAASAFLTVELDDSMGGAATQVRVTQGQEPAHLMSIFKGKPLVINLGGTSRKGGESKPCSTRLFHIRKGSTRATRAVEVEPTASSLNTNDVFLLKTPNGLYIWKGKGLTPEEMDAAKYVACLLGGTATEVEETKEPTCFWEALGGKAKYQTSRTLQNMIKPPRLYGVSNKIGVVTAEEVPGDWTQLDLATDDVMMLDTGDQVYIWIGNDANETEKKGAVKIAEDYVNTDPSGRSGIPINIIKQGQEPPTFTGWFHAWDKAMWDKEPMEIMKQRIQ